MYRYITLHHAVHSDETWVPLREGSREDFGLPETINHAVGISDYITADDFLNFIDKSHAGARLSPSLIGALFVSKVSKGSTFCAINRMKQKKKNPGALPRLMTFHALFQQKEGIFVVVVCSRVENWDLKVAKTSWMLNAAAGYLVDGCRVVKVDGLRKLDDGALEQQLYSMFGWLQLFRVYQVIVNTKDVEEGKVCHQIMPADNITG
ncbi:expressed unknown protein [Seminavis robusta]|uniref:Uncharacterized protein n=1 Tax=Seminavis robusta TaxID=568900 RepID=A0A9N8EEI1_9STRA|nr:expressed unknown protein [Seminavis robusta]|eukprot:Sro1064_g237190.1 n/a (207) ;mRNA; r:592-1212